MNKGIEILLARMDSHPQEFCHETMYGRYGRWTSAIDKVTAVGGSFTEEERKALNTKLYELERERFTQDVMRKLLEDAGSDDAGNFRDLYKRIAMTAKLQSYVNPWEDEK